MVQESAPAQALAHQGKRTLASRQFSDLLSDLKPGAQRKTKAECRKARGIQAARSLHRTRNRAGQALQPKSTRRPT